ncbi:YcnI family protein [Arthrobacter sp. PAMC25284]|uniref:YcnI family copper-binding membrane protein n=1 Tax=Arthrobacter sp. PAMC25284 TaxID=2861279 RepID=UPI001C631908|nr:YcnI family protein [Arthrobacter sp. PAMC25284]QYF91438.1 YcnI family protein [Arthrobacter sp. PAMC25284]
MTLSPVRRALTATAVAGGTAALMLAGVSGASAHVGATPDKTAANSYALVTFGIPHGCDTFGTTRVTITLPAELNDAQPTVNPNWTVERVEEQLPEPKTLADGSSITKRTSRIVYTAKAPLDPHFRDALVLSVKLPDTPGKTLYFPTLQNCEQGQTDWATIPQEGQDHDSVKSPAPSVTVTEAVADGHAASGAPAGTASATTHDLAQATSVTDDGAQARSWAGLVAGVGGLVLGGLAFLRRRAPQQ